MTRRHMFLASFAAVFATASAGVAMAQPYGAPPPYAPVPELRREYMPPPPRRDVVWEPGHWHWDGRQYVWFRGHYIPARAEYRHYVPGHWDRRGPQWAWIPAHWE